MTCAAFGLRARCQAGVKRSLPDEARIAASPELRRSAGVTLSEVERGELAAEILSLLFIRKACEGSNDRISAQVGEWLKPTDCKSVPPSEVRRFESFPVHQFEADGTCA